LAKRLAVQICDDCVAQRDDLRLRHSDVNVLCKIDARVSKALHSIAVNPL
jgi:hypothetical protein